MEMIGDTLRICLVPLLRQDGMKVFETLLQFGATPEKIAPDEKQHYMPMENKWN